MKANISLVQQVFTKYQSENCDFLQTKMLITGKLVLNFSARDTSSLLSASLSGQFARTVDQLSVLVDVSLQLNAATSVKKDYPASSLFQQDLATSPFTFYHCIAVTSSLFLAQ